MINGVEPAGVSLRPLRHYLAGRLDGFEASGPLRAGLLAGGRSNITCLLVQDSRRWVLRRPPLGELLPTAHDMVREHRVLQGMARTGVPVPRPLLLCTDESVIGAPFLVMEHVEGEVIGTAAQAAALSPARADAVSRALVETLARLHGADPIAAGLGDLGRPAGYLRRQVRRWHEQWHRCATGELPELDELVRRLYGQLPDGEPTGGATVVHGDYRLDNLIVAPAARVRAVLDWEMATLGDPLADLGLLLVYWSEPGDRLRAAVPVARGVTAFPGFWDRQQVAAHYLDLTGRQPSHLDACVGLACFKLAVVLQGIHARYLAGDATGDDVSDVGGGVPALAQLGLTVTSGAGIEGLSG